MCIWFSVIAETNDGSILFVFGDEAAAAAHQKESPASQPTAKPEEPAEQPSAPAESNAVEAAQPEAEYEKARGKKFKEAVKEAKVKDGAKTSGMYSSGPLNHNGKSSTLSVQFSASRESVFLCLLLSTLLEGALHAAHP